MELVLGGYFLHRTGLFNGFYRYLGFEARTEFSAFFFHNQPQGRPRTKLKILVAVQFKGGISFIAIAFFSNRLHFKANTCSFRAAFLGRPPFFLVVFSLSSIPSALLFLNPSDRRMRNSNKPNPWPRYEVFRGFGATKT